MIIFLNLPNILLHKDILSLEVSASNFIKKTLAQVLYGEFYERHKKILPKNNFGTVTAAVCKFGKILAYCKIKINMLSNLWWHHHCSDHCNDSDIVKIFCHTKRWKAVLIKAHHNSLVTNFILDPKQRYLYNECLSQIWNDSCLL